MRAGNLFGEKSQQKLLIKEKSRAKHFVKFQDLSRVF